MVSSGLLRRVALVRTNLKSYIKIKLFRNSEKPGLTKGYHANNDDDDDCSHMSNDRRKSKLVPVLN
jgi:hypothetical protein